MIAPMVHPAVAATRKPARRAAALLLALLVSAPAAAESVTVLDQIVLGETRFDGLKIGEFSAVVRNPAGGGVLAISDRGYIADFALDTTGDRLRHLGLRGVRLLTGADGAPLRDGDFSPEAATLLPDGNIAIVDEAGPLLAVFDVTGRWLRDEALPEPLRDAALQASDKDGIEALAWTFEAGFIAITEEPALGDPRHLHRIHTTQAGSQVLDASASDAISIKGMEVQGNRLLILERTKESATGILHPFPMSSGSSPTRPRSCA